MVSGKGFSRYAVYYTPTGSLAAFGASWLGWDAAQGRAVPQPVIAGVDLAAVTATPRRYGFHATMKAPFRLAEGQRASALEAALEAFCAAQAPVVLQGGLRHARLGTFQALIPAAESAALRALEARLVPALDPFRAALTEAEITRRDPSRLTPRQRAQLARWGYPYVMEEFRFHMTLTGALDPATADRVAAALTLRLPPMAADLPIDALGLVGEDANGCFHLIRRVPLTG